MLIKLKIIRYLIVAEMYYPSKIRIDFCFELIYSYDEVVLIGLGK